MRRPFGNSNDDVQEQQINLTPMLDVVFIMLIFFIVTATFVKEVGIDINQPDNNQPVNPDPNKKSIVVRITSRDRIIISQNTTWTFAPYAPISSVCTRGESRSAGRRGCGSDSSPRLAHPGDTGRASRLACTASRWRRTGSDPVFDPVTRCRLWVGGC
ncbi:MAG: biopolymer transporter ExbD [Pseudomonadales bacterium]